MIVTSSQHSIAVRQPEKACYYEEPVRLFVNLRQLTDLLRSRSLLTEDSDTALSDVANIKQSIYSAVSDDTSQKRSTVLLEVQNSEEVEHRELPVWRHSWNIGCTMQNGFNEVSKEPERHKFGDDSGSDEGDQPYDGHDAYDIRTYINDRLAEESGWMEEEQDWLNALKDRRGGSTEPVIFDLGVVSVESEDGRIVLCCNRDSSLRSSEPLLRIPSLHDQSQDDEDRDRDKYDLFDAADLLETVQRTTVSASLYVILLPLSALDDGAHCELPFRFRIDTTVSLNLPGIFEQEFGHRYAAEMEVAQRRFLSFLFPATIAMPPNYQGDTDIPFFLSVLGPAPALSSSAVQDAAQPEKLLPTLLPFQRRSVSWMLGREGKMVNNAGEIVPITPKEMDLPVFWEKINCYPEQDLYFNRLSGMLLPAKPPRDEFPGGILAEEPGLGKTLESISLVLLNPAINRHPAKGRWDPEARIEVKEIKTTLIVTPTALAKQWADELTLHAPTLNVLYYDGWATVPALMKGKGSTQVNSKSPKGKRKRGGAAFISRKKGKRDALDDTHEEESGLEETFESADWCLFVNQFDVCITTYGVLQQDLSVARAPVKRPRREAGHYSNLRSFRSPLIMCEWYRIIMDEVQMVGGGKTEEMVSLIPRLSSFAVSGTPARARVADLVHVLKFLRVEPAVATKRLWSRLLEPQFAGHFASLFSKIAIRTTKSEVKAELTIPEQKRFVVPIELGRIERHVYDQNLEQALLDLGLDARGIAASEEWQVDVTVLRSWLRKLRGICTHPQVGQLQRQSDKAFKPGGLKTLSEVLESMKDESWRDLMEGRKSKVQALIRRAQLIQRHETDLHRYRNALDVLLTAQMEIEKLGQDIKDTISEHDVKGQVLREEIANRRGPKIDKPSEKDNGKGKQRAESVPLSDDDSQDDLFQTRAGEEHAHKRRALQARLRECYVVQHQVQFLLGDVYHMLGASNSSLEDDAYAAAENTRKTLLKATEEAANRSMLQLNRTATKKVIDMEQLHIPYCGQGGVRSDLLLREADGIIDVLNEQAQLLWQWRAQIFELLTAKLSAGGEDTADGEEYARTLETQGEAETYLQAYATLMADRKEVMVAERTALAALDIREKKMRRTKAANKAAAAAAAKQLELLEEVELQPEHEALKGELAMQRKIILGKYHGRAIKSITVDLSAVAARIVSDQDPEKILAKEWAKHLRRLISDQGKLHDTLEADMAQFRKAFNDRIQYFRQLQELSDSVADAMWDGSVEEAIVASENEVKVLEADINKDRARNRYLAHMTLLQEEEDDDDDDDRLCILCRCEFVTGFITQCAHVFCEACLKAWLAKREGKACPVCRVIINVDKLQRISMRDKEREKALQLPHPASSDPSPKSRRVIRYNTINSALFQEIKNVECHGSYGSKIQSLVQHLLYLQEEDPGAKSIVFSAWSDSLHIIEHALIANGILSLRIDNTRNAADVFKNDPDILVLLLHGERENAGLNVTCASRVFLVESVVQHAFEIQAIARIDRMGQTRPTEVYCYYAEDTVERNILDLAARQGQSLYTQDHSSGTLNVTSFAMNAQKAIDSPLKKAKQKGDFIFKADDMLAILFPHMFEDLEYLLPDSMDRDVEEPSSAQQCRSTAVSQPVAGPSRIT